LQLRYAQEKNETVLTVRAETMNIPPLAIHAVPNGEKALEALVI
jgi:FMN-dependent NADH-azoreductase